MWEIDFAEQIISFFQSILLGGIFGLIYDIFRIPVRRKGVSAVAVFIADILYFAFIGVVNFCFLLTVSCGEVRGYLLLGAAFGFFVYKKALSPILSVAAAFVFKPLRMAFSLLKRGVTAFSNLVWGGFSKIKKKITEIIKFLLKKG